jgi:hypothetical protein
MAKDVDRASRSGVIERLLVTPVRELVLGLRDAFSPEMTHARIEAMLPELRRLGSFRFALDRMARIVGATVPAGVLIRVAPLIAKGAGWGVFTEPKTLRYIALLFALSVSIGLYSVCAVIYRLRREYPDEL